MSDRAAELAETFATNVLAACAESIGSTADEIRAVLTTRRRPPASHAQIREDWDELAEWLFPDAGDPTRKLTRIVLGKRGLRPLWESLAALEEGLGVPAWELMRDDRQAG